MNMSNRFEIETVARQRQAEIEHQLRRVALPRDQRPAPALASMKPNVRKAMIMAGAGSLSTLIAFSVSNLMVLAISSLR